MPGNRACVYLDMRTQGEEVRERCILRICGPNTTLGELQADAETCAAYGEILAGIRIYYEDPLRDPKEVKRVLCEGGC